MSPPTHNHRHEYRSPDHECPGPGRRAVRIYWHWVDSLPEVASALTPGEYSQPLVLHLLRAATGQRWDVEVKPTTDGMELKVGWWRQPSPGCSPCWRDHAEVLSCCSAEATIMLQCFGSRAAAAGQVALLSYPYSLAPRACCRGRALEARYVPSAPGRPAPGSSSHCSRANAASPGCAPPSAG